MADKNEFQFEYPQQGVTKVIFLINGSKVAESEWWRADFESRRDMLNCMHRWMEYKEFEYGPVN